ncbi:MAG TPA: hypothetical protein VJH34_01925 [archaeon]|nr:hypothetical protein [archaeon]
MNREHYRHVGIGFLAGLLLLGTYFLIVGLLQGLNYAIDRFSQLWYFMLPLTVGFGFQIGFYSCFRSAMSMNPGTSIASGGVSTVSMVACCAHHLTDVIPFLGISVIGVFLLQYQSSFLVIGIVSNLIGILMMINIAKKSRYKFKNPSFKRFVKRDLNKLTTIVLILGIVAIIASFLLQSPVSNSIQNSSMINLPAKTDDNVGVIFTVQPLEFNADTPIKFKISISTHTTDLDFDLTKVSYLVADSKSFTAVDWEGSAPGGHHRSGTLTFGSLGYMPKTVRLSILDVTGADRIFEWTVS